MIHTLNKFVELCEWSESIDDTETSTTEKKLSKEGKKGKHKCSGKKDMDEQDYYCMSHSDNLSHNTENCHALQSQAKCMKSTYEAQAPTEKKKHQKKKELHAMAAEAM